LKPGSQQQATSEPARNGRASSCDRGQRPVAGRQGELQAWPAKAAIGGWSGGSRNGGTNWVNTRSRSKKIDT